MDRKFLPYEHQLIKALGVSKEEYLEFVAIQQEYQDPKAGTELDIRNDMGVTAIVLTVVGILFQVGAALLTPKPKNPDIDTKNQQRSREQRFAPTSGFNSTQELASYGDPVNLVYTNTTQNPNGGVRVAGSLVWSGIENFGSAQFMQLLLVLGASRIYRIKEEYTAFGQIGLQDFDPALMWMFYKQNDGSPGPVLFNDIVFGYPTGKQNAGLTEQLQYLPERLKTGQVSDQPVCRILTHNRNYQRGFSQAYSPTTASSFGIYDPVPIRIKYFGRDDDGDEKDAPNRIGIRGNNWGSTKEGDFFLLFFDKLENKDEDIRRSMDDMRQRLFETIDFGGTYLLGSAKYTLEFKSSDSIANSDVTCKFRCIQDGSKPFTSYLNDEDSDQQTIEIPKSRFIAARKALSENRKYSNAISIFGLGISYNFSGHNRVQWTDENGVPYTIYIPRSGSIEYTERQQKNDLADPKKLITAQERRRLQSEIKQLKRYRRRLRKGVFDDSPRIQNALRSLVRNNNRMKIQKQKKKDQQRLIESYTDDFVRGLINRVKKNRQIRDAQEKISQIDELIIELEGRFVEEARFSSIQQTEDSPRFRGLDGRLYDNGGLEQVQILLQDKQVATNKIIDQKGQTAINKAYEDLLDEKDEALNSINRIIKQYKDIKIRPSDRNKNFYTKCLVKAESASYETISAVDIVKFSIKSSIYRRIAGRQKRYGEEKEAGYRTNDNGIQARIAFFEVSYKQVGSSSVYKKFPFIFAVRGGTESDVYNQLNFEPSQSGVSRKRWQFKFDPVIDIMADRVGPSVGLIADSGSVQSETHEGNTWWWRGEKLEGLKDGYPLIMHAPGPKYTNQIDMFSAHSDTQYQFSFDRGPEFILSAVTEQQIATTTSERNALEYDDCTTMAMIVRAGRGIQDLRNITTFVQRGKRCFTVENFTNVQDGSSSYAPDIFVDTALDKNNGVGKYIRRGHDVLDQDSLKLAKRFCKNNNLPTESGGKINLFMDGVIADATSWREFWVANGPFSLLELARKNGRDTLVSAVPVDNGGRAAQDDGTPVPVSISALFTTGNILEGTFKEEFLDYGTSTEELIATVIYRELDQSSVFPRKATVEIRAKGIDDNDAIRETFDASAYVTQREQAIMIGKLLVNQRRHILRGIEFKTFPSRAPLEPSAFIYVDIGNISWDRYSSGVVMEDGNLNSPLHDEISNGSYSFLLYDSATGETVSRNSVSVSNSSASSLSSYKGWMYVMGEAKPSKRVFRITEVAFDEEGEVTVKAMEYPVYDDLGAKIADFRSSQFKVS